ncbi:MAG: ATP-dependent helicase HrpB [Spirochaetota bacterium]
MPPPPTGLPIEAFLPEISQRLSARGTLVLSAEPGAGKTSLVPLALAERQENGGKILVVEPRRVAAVSAAARMAELTCSSVGERIGYRVKGEMRASRSTRIEVVTTGVLVRMLAGDPFLETVATVVFDEFHERPLEADLALALAREARKARAGKLELLLMSATFDGGALAQALDADSMSVPGRVFPVETRYSGEAPPRDGEAFVARVVLGAADREAGDILVFLPGMAEILRVEGALAGGAAERGIETLRLHGSLPLAEQRRAILPARDAARRIILTTSIAETSLTVPRVGVVVDSGLARGSRYDRRSGLCRLVTTRESADRAQQRRGRAGRLGPGICIRLWAESERLPEATPPEILTAELSGLVLECLFWGAKKIGDLEWLDAPPEAAWKEGLETLHGLGALEGGEPGEPGRSVPKLSEKGCAMAALGTEPRIAALVLEGAAQDSALPGSAALACLAAALAADGSAGSTEDFAQRVENLAQGALARGGQLASGGQGDPSSRRVLDEARRLASRASLSDSLFQSPSLPAPLPLASLAGLFASAWPDRVARRMENSGSSATFAIPAGRLIKASGALSGASWIVVIEADSGEATGRLYSGLALGESEALAALQPLVETQVAIEWSGRSYRARRERRAGSIILSSTALGALVRETLGQALLGRLAREGLAALLPDGPAEAWLARWNWWRKRNPGALAPSFEDTELAPDAHNWLFPFLDPSPLDILPGRSLLLALEGRLPRAVRLSFEAGAPTSIRLPSGVERTIDYSGASPRLEGRVHDFYGLKEHPRIAGEPLVLALLSPAGRPIQVTADLLGFWKGSWTEARKELRGRYPRHDWPEDPSMAAPTRRSVKGNHSSIGGSERG